MDVRLIQELNHSILNQFHFTRVIQEKKEVEMLKERFLLPLTVLWLLIHSRMYTCSHVDLVLRLTTFFSFFLNVEYVDFFLLSFTQKKKSHFLLLMKGGK